MSTAYLQIVGEDILCHHPQISDCRLDGPTYLPQLRTWAEDYEKAVCRNDEIALLDIGRAMYASLNGSGWIEQWSQQPGPRQLEIVVGDTSTALACALLDAPWELLANAGGHLADDGIQAYELARRIGQAQAPRSPQYRDLQVMFMAAAPQGEHVLDFENEEAAILAATERLPLHLLVEESGNLQFLGERLSQEGSCEILHLSCHGGINPKKGPVLALEDECGQLATMTCEDLVCEIDPQRIPLVFLSACRSAEQYEQGRRVGEPMVRAMVRAGFAHAIGWDGSVYDSDARQFAEVFYTQLLKQHNAAHACALARQHLRSQQLSQPERQQGQHWHLARLYLGPHGGGPLLSPKLAKRPAQQSGKQFLDQGRQVPVAGQHEFVGRRRILQNILTHVRSQAPGVVLHGMGNLGKSSVAYRISTRLRRPTAVVFGKYDADWIFEQLLALLPPDGRKAYRDTWQSSIRETPDNLAEAIEALLTGPCANQPILLIIDDLEQILDAPQQGEQTCTVKSAYRSTLAAVIQGFINANSDSSLLFTSRYLFSLPDHRGQDLGARLAAVPLQPMEKREQEKQLHAASRQAKPSALSEEVATQLIRALTLAEGNPGLQTLLTHPLLHGEHAAAESAMAAIEHYQQHGLPPEALQEALTSGLATDQKNAVLEFFKRMAFEHYRAALTAEEVQFLRGTKLFSSGLAVPEAALIAVAQAASIADPERRLWRLQALGLFDRWPNETPPASAINPLARPLAGEVDETTIPRLAAAALEVLHATWRNGDGDYPRNTRALEACRLALLAEPCAADWLNGSAEATARLLGAQGDSATALESILLPAMQKLERVQENASHGLLLVAIDCARILGKMELLAAWLEKLQATAQSPEEIAAAALYRGRWLQSQGQLEDAFQLFGLAREKFLEAKSSRESIIAFGHQADIHQARGQLDEALRIRLDEQLPVFEKLGDVRSRAVTLGQIADIHQARGQLDEALRIRLDEQLPVFEKLGDVRSRAVTLGKIADIHQARGQLDEARKLHDERWPIVCELGDIDLQALILFKQSTLTLAAEGLTEENIESLLADLAQAFAINRQLQRPDGIGSVGMLLCQLLAAGGARNPALQVLNEAEAAWQLLEDTDALQTVSELRQLISSMPEES